MTCLRARTAVLAINDGGILPITATVAFPAGWDEDTLLEYARSAHEPRGEVLWIVEWHGARMWLANPGDFTDYQAGTR